MMMTMRLSRVLWEAWGEGFGVAPHLGAAEGQPGC